MKSTELTNFEDRDRNIYRILYVLDRALEEWFKKNFDFSTYPDFQFTYLSFFMRIGLSGISNSELAALTGVTKQGASRIVKKLVSYDLVKAEKSTSDARLSKLYLTESGKLFYKEMDELTNELLIEHIKVVGAKKYHATIDTLIELTHYYQIKGKK
ncbi:MarR family winged helix-turn-helix transcriptional regulator [Pedobacter hartonius]|uniref:DNA-binding transcriptional regulator, MarR family n=1 Tax=Pedobacter hartonius TaxID=425514 RepID=A0A1H4CSZ8_9SPHI|nr:MarR family transcriptional regulator [Pedobacter hartonius]SEA63242.1 DNA-binding transcriptional regulator, MarR family [Pedobacter hartonius]